ncbi:MAG TPA: hypothetical protein VJR58_15985 [Vineibacter sp.]|nr:hypothetical protein [Vineibacter sp.]
MRMTMTMPLCAMGAALTLASCDGGGQTYALPPPPPMAEPTASGPTPSETPSRPRPIYTPPPKSPTWTLMPSQRTSCGRNFC